MSDDARMLERIFRLTEQINALALRLEQVAVAFESRALRLKALGARGK